MANSRVLYETKYLQLKATVSKSGNEWVYAHRPNISGVVVIIPIINKEKVLFLLEERPPIKAEGIGQYSIALPAGLVGDVRINENKIDAIEAELLEETGLVADNIKIVAENVASSPGCVSEVCTIAIANVSEYKLENQPVDDGGIIVDRVLVDIDNIYDWLRDKECEGYILTAQTLAALFFLKENI